MNVLEVGDAVPDFVLHGPDGERWTLGEHRGRPIVLVFHRHLACLPCQEHIRDVRDHLDELGDAAVAVVTFSPIGRLAEYRAYLEVPFPVLTDTDRAVYAMFGFVRGRIRDVWSLATVGRYLQLLRQGRRMHRPTEDTLQLGGDVVIGRDGRLRYIARPPGPTERPPVDDLRATLD